MAEWDLISKIGPYLDRHLVFPLLEFLTVKEYYDETDLLRGKLDLLSNTSMVDFAMDVHKSLYPDKEVPATLRDKRAQVVENFKRLQAETEPVLKIFEDPEVTKQIQQSRDSKQLLEFLVKNYSFKPEMIDTCYNFAKVQYECGNYSGASEYLYFHRILVQPTDANYLNGMWGKLAAEILMQNWDTALEDLNRLKQFIDESTFGSSLQTLQRLAGLDTCVECPRLVAAEGPQMRQADLETVRIGQPVEFVAHLIGGVVVHVANEAQCDVVVFGVDPAGSVEAAAFHRQGELHVVGDF